MSEQKILGIAALAVIVIYAIYLWLSRKSPIDAASMFLKSRNGRTFKDHNDY